MGKARSGLSALAGVLAIGIVVIVGGASLVFYLVPSGSGSGQASTYQTVTLTSIQKVTSIVNSDIPTTITVTWTALPAEENTTVTTVSTKTTVLTTVDTVLTTSTSTLTSTTTFWDYRVTNVTSTVTSTTTVTGYTTITVGGS